MNESDDPSNSSSDLPDHPGRSTGRAPRRFLAIAVITIAGVLVVGFGAIFIYTEVINDSPDELDESDLSAALDATTTVLDASAPDPAATGSARFDGDWVATDASEFGYRVEEVIAGVNSTAVGRSNEIDGTLTIDGAAAVSVDVEVEVESITSDQPRRDNQFRGRIMNSDRFPTATFTLTQPIEFGSVPTDGQQVTATATGDLTLRGVTKTVTFDVTAQVDAVRIGVLGSIPVLFSDYGIDNPTFSGVKTEDNGLVEFVLVFERA